MLDGESQGHEYVRVRVWPRQKHYQLVIGPCTVAAWLPLVEFVEWFVFLVIVFDEPELV